MGLAGFGATGLLATEAGEATPTGADVYEHRTTYSYEGRVTPSALHPDGRIEGPEASGTSEDEGEGAEWGTPVQIGALRDLTLQVDYAFQMDGEPAAVGGSAGATALIESLEGWSTTVQLVDGVEWTDGQARLELALTGDALLDRIDEITAEMGSGGPYDITIEPHVHVVGEIEGQPVDETHQPSFAMQLDGPVLFLQSNAVEVETRRLVEAGNAGAAAGSAGLELPGGSWGLAGLLVLLAIAGASGGVLALGWGRDEAGRIESRYRTLLVNVDEVEHPPGCHFVEVQTIAGLARIAKACDGVILHQALNDGHRYSVVDIDAVYAFAIGDTKAFSAQEPPPTGAERKPDWGMWTPMRGGWPEDELRFEDSKRFLTSTTR